MNRYNSVKDMASKSVEEVLCLTVLIATGTLPPTADLDDSREYYAKLFDDCGRCPHMLKCLASIINE